MTDKVTIAIERIKEGALMAERFTGKPMVVCYSGGKDSEVIRIGSYALRVIAVSFIPMVTSLV